MSSKFKTIGLIGKYGADAVAEPFKGVVEFLSGRGIQLLTDDETAKTLPGLELRALSRDELGRQSDLVIVIGGDGSLLNAARSMASHQVPLLGINLGRLGFLVDISPQETLQRLEEILNGQYSEEERFLLRCEIYRNDELIAESSAMNDVVVHKWDVSRMIEFETQIDGQFLHTMRSDGMVVATPTGSTAYALSGGGPILEPHLNAIVLVPICPHTLTNRPIVVDGTSEIEILLYDHGSANAQLTCDGQIDFSLVYGDRVRVRRHEPPIRILHPYNYDYFKILRTKLHWGTRPY